MAVKVVDASAIAAILFNEPDAPKVVAAIADDALVAPSLLAYEIASVCLKKIRLHPERHDLYRSSMLLLSRLDVQMDPVNMDAAVVLAAATRLSVYDACYLWLARTLRAELVTLDKPLAAAARK
jgi:predicted nucleic acid-binding protein